MQIPRMLRKALRWGLLLYCVSIFLAVASLFYLLHSQLRSEELQMDFTIIEINPQRYDTSPFSEENTDDTFYIDLTENKWNRRFPNALIVGIRKGGTRALIDSVSRHPRVKACPREVHFFDRQENYKQGLDWYKSQMPLSLENHITIEKTPAYFVTEDAPRLVYKMSPSVKLLVVVRDPTVRAISDYAQLYDKSHGKLRPFEEYVTEDSHHQVLRATSSIVTTGIYVNHLKKWLEYFPIEQIHFVNGEELVKNPVHEMRSVENFLGLEPFIDETLYYFNETKGFPCLVPTSKKSGEQPVSGCLSETKGRPHPPVSEDVVTLLRDFYRPFNEEFYRAVGNNFGWP